MRWPWSSTKANRAQALDASREYGVVGQLTPRYKDFNSYLKAYKLPWVNACVGVIAYNCANVSFNLVDTLHDDGDDRRTVEQSPFLNLLRNPNPQQSGFAFRETTLTHLELTGNAFWALEEIDGRGQPHELYLLRPDCVTVIPDAATLIKGYSYTVNGKSVTYEPDEILHLRYPNPMDDFYGMGQIEASESRMDSEQAMGEHERMFWRNGAKITGVLQTDQPVDDSVFNRIVMNFRRFLTGSGYSTVVLEAGLKYQSVSDGPAKLGMLEMAKASRDQILAIFGVPPTKIGILENANYKATASDTYFWRETLEPKLTRIEQALQPLVDRFHPGQHLRLAFERRTFDDDSQQAEVAQMMANSHVYTVNEIRAYTGKEPLPEGGDIVLDSDGSPIDFSGSLSTVNEIRREQREAPLLGGDEMIVIRGRATQIVLNGVPTATVGASPGVPKPAGAPALPAPPTKMRVSPDRPATAGMLKRHQEAALKRADRYVPSLQTFFDGQHRRIVAKLASYKRRKAIVSIDGLFDADDERERLLAVVGPIQLDALEAGIGSALVASLPFHVDLDNPRIKAYLEQLTDRIAVINETTRTQIADMIDTGLARGYSIKQIAEGVPADDYAGVAGVYSQATGYRAEMIARTETAMAYRGAQLIAYKASGVSQVEAIDGEHFDATCAVRNGQIMDLDTASTIVDHPNGTLAWIPVLAEVA